MSRAQIAIPQEQIESFCKRHHIRRLSLFGSVLRGDFRPDSDVDVLVEFAPGFVPGLAFFEMQEELSAILGAKGGPEHARILEPPLPDRLKR